MRGWRLRLKVSRLKTELVNVNENHKATQSSLKQETQALQQAKEENKELTNQATKLKTTVAGLEARVDDRNTKIIKLEKENEKLQEFRQEAADLKAESNSSKARVRELAQETGSLKQENKTLHKEVGSLQGQLEVNRKVSLLQDKKQGKK